MKKGRFNQPILKIGIAVTASAVMSAGADSDTNSSDSAGSAG
jgi:hypothetical protein